jgi:hypothetical protein
LIDTAMKAPELACRTRIGIGRFGRLPPAGSGPQPSGRVPTSGRDQRAIGSARGNHHDVPGRVQRRAQARPTLTYQEGFALSRQYDRSPDSPAGGARSAFDRIVNQRGLTDAKSEWLRAAGDAVIEAISAEPFDMSHVEGWRWATQPVLDVARAILAREHLLPEDYTALRRPWDWLVAGGVGTATAPTMEPVRTAPRLEPTKRARRVQELPWLEERVGVYETFVKGMIMSRPTYSVAYVVIRNRNGSHRVTHRGTGFHDYFFETDIAEDEWALDGVLDLLVRRFKLNGAQLQREVRYFQDLDAFATALETLPND